jgi:hypothetical protein
MKQTSLKSIARHMAAVTAGTATRESMYPEEYVCWSRKVAMEFDL